MKEIVSEKNLNKPFAVFAEYQSAGRGQRQKFWESNSGDNILLSMFFPTQIKMSELQYINQGFSLIVAECIENELAKNDIREKLYIKWPNDLILKTKKIAGILIETSIREDHVSSVFMGLGINVLQKAFSEGLPRAASLRSLYPTIAWDRAHLLQQILKRMEQFIVSFETTKNDIRQPYLARVYKLHEEISLKERGRFVNKGIDLEGNLVLKHLETNDEIVLKSTSGIDWDY
jgi:BirA family biotin operon repressor/biotin-[acetyl-CoA-carboxylase] ligase